MNVTAIRHVAFEDLDLISPLLGDIGVEITYVNAWELDKQTAETADMVVFLGGPINANNEDNCPFLTDEVAIAETRLAAAEGFQRWFAEIGFNR